MRRTLLINADDIGIYPETVRPAVETVTDGLAASGSVITVSSGSDLALSVLATRPDVLIGVHLALTRGFPSWRWDPLTGGASIQRDGLLAPIELREALLAQARIDHIATEFRLDSFALTRDGGHLEATLDMASVEWCLAAVAPERSRSVMHWMCAVLFPLATMTVFDGGGSCRRISQCSICSGLHC